MSQNVSLPEDLRQHNLTEYNASLLNPAFSLTRNNAQSIALWTRWQWQSIDTNPSTIFLNYTTKLSNKSTFGAGFFQHNTGLFFNTGGVLNYAYSIEFSSKVQLDFGINLFAYNRSVVDETLLLIPMPNSSDVNDFILQAAPGIFLKINKFGIGLTSENLFDYNFTINGRDSTPDERIYAGTLSYDFEIGGNKNTLRPMVYAKSLPLNDTQIGGNLLFSTDKYWAQGGYNSFYGPSFGAGVRLFKKLSIGALIEYGIDDSFEDVEPTFEIYASYFFKSQVFEEEEEEKEEELLEKEEEKLAKKEAKALAAEEKAKRKDSLATLKKEKKALSKKDKISKKEQKRINEQEAEEAKALIAQKEREEKRLDSIKAIEAEKTKALALKKEAEELSRKKEAEQLAAKQAQEKVEVAVGEKYQEVTNEDELQPGFYLIANVFGTKKYFNAFLNDLRKKGIEPKSFYRSFNKYNYAYLERYDSIEEARRARDSNFNGKYQGDTWIFRVK